GHDGERADAFPEGAPQLGGGRSEGRGGRAEGGDGGRRLGRRRGQRAETGGEPVEGPGRLAERAVQRGASVGVDGGQGPGRLRQQRGDLALPPGEPPGQALGGGEQPHEVGVVTGQRRGGRAQVGEPVGG